MKQLIWTTTNFIAPVMVIFLAVLAFFLYPRVYNSTGDGSGCQAGKMPTKYEEATLYPTGVDWSSDEFQPNTQYVKIRQDIPITTDLTAFCPELYSQTQNTCVHFSPMRTPEYPDDIVLYPRPAAEHDFMNSLTQKPGDFFPLKEKMLFFLHMESIYQPKILTIRQTLSPTGANGATLYYEKILLADAYQEKKKYQEVMAGLSGYRYEDVFKCDEGGPLPKLTDEQINRFINTPGFNDPVDPVRIPELDALTSSNQPRENGSSIYIPPQSRSPNNEQLQLEWFVFDQSQGAWNSHCKPAVYLYPPQKMSVNVKVFPAGTLTYTDPLYDSKSGWTVDAYPDGTIYDSRFTIYDKPFDYLYFESKVKDEVIKKPTKGWVIKSELNEWFGPLEEKFNVLLPQLGLNAIQTKDFIDYWKKALPYSPYYFVGVVDQSNVDQIERLEITPKPDYINRVRIYFERLDQPRQVEAPDIVDQRTSELGNQTLDPDSPIHQSTNSLFRVVEWGGMVKNDPNHPFTCSQ